MKNLVMVGVVLVFIFAMYQGTEAFAEDYGTVTPMAYICAGNVFDDINGSVMSPVFCGYIEHFASLGITSGCSANPPLYCPDNPVTRGQMAVFMTALLEKSAGLFQKKLSNVAIVAKSGGDYDNPASAMADVANWCGTPSATNPCLLKIMPGYYYVGQLQMAPFIDIEGSGTGTTRLAGMVRGADNAKIKSLTVSEGYVLDIWAAGYAAYIPAAIAFYNDHASPRMVDLEIEIKQDQSGIVNWLFLVGIMNVGSSPVMKDIRTVLKPGCTISHQIVGCMEWSDAASVYNENTSPVLKNVAVDKRIENWSSGTVKIYDSSISWFYNNSGCTTYVVNSQISGSVQNSGVIKCVNSFDENYDPLNASCQ